jgi:hypothetical protein
MDGQFQVDIAFLLEVIVAINQGDVDQGIGSEVRLLQRVLRDDLQDSLQSFQRNLVSAEVRVGEPDVEGRLGFERWIAALARQAECLLEGCQGVLVIAAVGEFDAAIP